MGWAGPARGASNSTSSPPASTNRSRHKVLTQIVGGALPMAVVALAGGKMAAKFLRKSSARGGLLATVGLLTVGTIAAGAAGYVGSDWLHSLVTGEELGTPKQWQSIVGPAPESADSRTPALDPIDGMDQVVTAEKGGQP